MKWIIIALVTAAVGVGAFFVFNSSDDANNSNQNTNSSEMTNNENSNNTEQSTIAKLLERGDDIRCTFDHTDDSGNKNTGTAYFSNMRMSGDFTVAQANGETLQSNVLSLDDTQYVWQESSKQGYKISTENIDTKDDDDSSVAVDEDEEYDFNCEKWNVDESVFDVPSDVNFVDNSELINNIESQIENVGNVCEQLTDPAQRQACEQAIN